MPEVMHAAVVARILEGRELDLVHDHTLAGPLTAPARGVPTVATMHGPVDGELTPVVALRNGSVPEVVDDGRTGIICDTPEELAEGIEQATRLRPDDCRKHVSKHFDLPTMVSAYERLYRELTPAGRHT